MTREAGLDRRFRRLQIADLSHHHHVRVLSQNRPQPSSKGHVSLGVDLSLADAWQVVFNGVLDREDVDSLGAELGQGAIEGRRLTGACGTGDQKNTVGFVHHFPQPVQILWKHAEVGQCQPVRTLVQQSQHHPFAVAGRHRGDPNVHFTAADSERNSAVLGNAFLGDIEPRHDFDPRHQERRQLSFGLYHFPHHTIHSKPDHQLPLKGLDMNVRCVLPDRLREQSIDESDDGRIVLLLKEVFGFRHRISKAREIHLIAQILHHLPCFG